MSVRVCVDSPPLAGLSGTGVSVAVVDSGTNPGNPHVGRVAGGVGIELSGAPSADWVDRLGHGTAVFAAIQEKAPQAELYVVRVFRRQLATSVRALAGALDWAAEQGAGLVNMSLGTPREEQAARLAAALERLAAAGGVVVAAVRSEGQRWWPGTLPAALGVVADPDCPRGCVDIRTTQSGRRFVAASPYPRPIPGVPVERNLKGTSFAVANATGLVARALEGFSGRIDRKAVLDRLGSRNQVLDTSPGPQFRACSRSKPSPHSRP